jgi:hypothetical protein
LSEVTIALSEAEYERLADLAEGAGLGVAEYVRLCVFGPGAGNDPVSWVALVEGYRIRGRLSRNRRGFPL